MTTWTLTYEAPPSMGFSRQEYWSGVPLPSPVNKAAAAAKSLQSCLTLCNPRDGSQAPPSLGFSRQEHWSGLPFPSPMHESKSESEVAQLCLTLSDPMDFSLPGSSVYGFSRQEYWSGVPLPSPRQHIEKQRHYFAIKVLSSQGYGFSSGYVWM